MSTLRVPPRAVWAIAVAILLLAPGAHADDPRGLSIRWGKLAEMLRTGDFFPREAWQPLRDSKSGASGESPWMGTSPHVSLVARDWSGAQLLVGYLLLTDQVRLSRSCRMVLSRLRLVDGKFTPFIQVGFGQWRVDTDLMPFRPRDVELAAQSGGGFELALGEHAALAVEADVTLLDRDEREREPAMVAEARPWVAFAAARAHF